MPNQVAVTSSKTPEAVGLAIPLASVAGLFALWGIAQCDFFTLLYKLTAFFTLDRTQSNWIPAVLNISYFLVALPAAMFHRRFGYKLGIIAGLCLTSLGPFLLFPTFALHAYSPFLIAVVVITIGWPFLETCLNPLAIELGPRKSAVRRLNLVQSFFSFGVVVGLLAANSFLNFDLRPSDHAMARAMAHPFVVIGVAVLLLALVIDKVRFPAAASEKKTASFRDELRMLLARREFCIGLAAIFCCQLAQAICWGTGHYYMAEETPAIPADLIPKLQLICFSLAMIGRFSGTAAMRWIDPLALLGLAMLVSICLCLFMAVFGGSIGVWTSLSTSLFLSIAYPTIVGTALRDLGPLIRTASGLLVTFAGMGAACELLIVNTLRGTVPIRYLTLFEIPCFIVVVLFAAAFWPRRHAAEVD